MERAPFIAHMAAQHSTEPVQAEQVFRILASKSLRRAAQALRTKSQHPKDPAPQQPNPARLSAFVLLDSVEGHFKPVAVTVVKVEADKWKSYNPTQHDVQEFELDRLPI